MLCLRSMVMMMLMCSAVSALAAAPRDAMSVVSIRIHDYSLIDGRQLQQAEREVTDTYARIGVRRPGRPATCRPGSCCPQYARRHARASSPREPFIKYVKVLSGTAYDQI